MGIVIQIANKSDACAHHVRAEGSLNGSGCGTGDSCCGHDVKKHPDQVQRQSPETEIWSDPKEYESDHPHHHRHHLNNAPADGEHDHPQESAHDDRCIYR